MQPLIKKVVKRPAQNKFVLRTAARGLAFCKGRPQGAACKVRPAGSFFAMKKVRQVWGAAPRVKARVLVFCLTFYNKKSKAGKG